MPTQANPTSAGRITNGPIGCPALSIANQTTPPMTRHGARINAHERRRENITPNNESSRSHATAKARAGDTGYPLTTFTLAYERAPPNHSEDIKNKMKETSNMATQKTVTELWRM